MAENIITSNQVDANKNINIKIDEFVEAAKSIVTPLQNIVDIMQLVSVKDNRPTPLKYYTSFAKGININPQRVSNKSSNLFKYKPTDTDSLTNVFNPMQQPTIPGGRKQRRNTKKSRKLNKKSNKKTKR